MTRRFRKRREGLSAQTDRDPVSGQVRAAIKNIQNRKVADGLAVLDRLAGTSLIPARKTQILAILGDVQLQQFDYPAALAAYARAERSSSGTSRAWLRPAIGQVITLLRDLKTDAAWSKAREILETADEAQRQLAAAIDQAERRAEAGEVVSFEGLPHRKSYVGFRLGNLFWVEGYPEMAEPIFKKMVEENPKGASRCRLGLAQIALSQQNWASARSWSLSAIEVGKFRAKTLSAIAPLIKAATALDTKIDLASLLQGYHSGRRRIRERAYFEIITGLRNHCDPEWITVAQSWLALSDRTDRVLETEVRKLLLADAKLISAIPETRTALSRSLLDCANLQFAEWSFAARESLKASPSLADELIAAGSRRFGPKRRHAIVHRLARAALESGNDGLARRLLVAGLGDAPKAQPSWGRMAWLLARLEEQAGDFTTAAGYFLAIQSRERTPQRVKLIALLAWARNAMKAGLTEQILQRREEFIKATDQVSDYALLLDMARQAGNTSLEFKEITFVLFAKGKAAALRVIRQSPVPAAARQAWFVLTRRFADFGQNDEIISLWESFSEDFRERIWSGDDNFWEGLEYVVRAYHFQGRTDAALALAGDYIDRSTAPPHGIARIAAQMAIISIKQGELAAGLSRYQQVIVMAPTHPLAAPAYYWKALEALAHGDRANSRTMAARIVFCVGLNPGLNWQQFIRYQGAILEHDLDLPSTTRALGNPKIDFLQAAYDRIKVDLAKFP